MEPRNEIILNLIEHPDMSQYNRIDPELMRKRADQARKDKIKAVEMERNDTLKEVIDYIDSQIINAAQHGNYMTTAILGVDQVDKLEEFWLVDVLKHHYAPFRITRKERTHFKLDFRKNKNQ